MWCFVVLGLVFPYQAKRLAWGTSRNSLILCRVGRETLTHSVNQEYGLMRETGKWRECCSCCNGSQTVENSVQTLSLAEWMQLPGLTFAEWRNNYSKCVARRLHIISWKYLSRLLEIGFSHSLSHTLIAVSLAAVSQGRPLMLLSPSFIPGCRPLIHMAQFAAFL